MSSQTVINEASSVDIISPRRFNDENNDVDVDDVDNVDNSNCQIC